MAGAYDLNDPAAIDRAFKETLRQTRRPQSIDGLRKTATSKILSEARHQFADLLTRASGALRPDAKPTFRAGLAGGVEAALGVGRNLVADSFESGSDALHQYAEALPGGKNTPVRMTGNIDSLYVDPRVLDVADATTLGLAGGVRVAKGAALGLRDAVRGGLEDVARGGMSQIWQGPGSSTWNQANAEKFVAREAADGADLDTDYAWRSTGTARVKDGSLIQEIDDADSQLRTDHAWEKPFWEVVDHPKLRDAYGSFFDDVKVDLTIDRLFKGRGYGQYDSDRKRISIVAPNADEARRIMLHEANHAVSRLEGRATGGSPRSAGGAVEYALNRDPYATPELREKLGRFVNADGSIDDHAAYEALQDEVLSRGTEVRRDMAPNERANTPPEWDVPEPEWIVSRDNDASISMADGSGGGRGPSFKKTVKAYKLFRIDPKQPGKLFPLFVDANTPVPIGEWVEAVAGKPGKGGKGVSSKIGDLAYRPGWHAGDMPIATHIGGKSKGAKKPDYRPDNHVWAEVEMPADTDWQSIANQRGTNAQGRVVPVKAHITDQIPFGGHYRYKTNPNMTGDWMISGNMRVNRVLDDAEVARINQQAGVADLPRQRPVDLSAFGPQRTPATVNIGLVEGRTGAAIDPQEALTALEELGLLVNRHNVRHSASEPTLIADIDNALTPEQGDALSRRLRQEAIAQRRADGTGALFGPKADDWGPFNEDFFLDQAPRQLTPADIRRRAGLAGEEDIGRSLAQAAGGPAGKAEPVTDDDLFTALRNRARYRAEPNRTPGPDASDDEWKAFGEAHGVNLTVTAPVEIAKGVQIPGGLDGTFTISDLFWMKANNFDPKKLPREVHDALMQKIMRTYAPNGQADESAIMRSLNFTQLSPNTPLLQNEFMSQRLRQAPGQSLDDLAAERRAMGDGDGVSTATGIQSAARGGLGLRGTADPSWMTTTAETLSKFPEMFRPRPGEGLHEVAQRLTSFLPGIGQKTGSLGVPFFDLRRANTSAVDLHMIRNNWQKLLTDPEVGEDFRKALAKRLKTEDTSPDNLIRTVEKRGKAGFTSLRSVIESQPTAVTRNAKTGDYNPRVPAAQRDLPAELEPKKSKLFNPFYNRIVHYVNESAAETGNLPLFLEQWRLWDTYRGRFEPHEFAHPDWAKLPKQSFNEMQKALGENRKAGFARKSGLPPGGYKGDWKKLYYGKADVGLLGGLALAGGAGAAGFSLLNDEE